MLKKYKHEVNKFMETINEKKMTSSQKTKREKIVKGIPAGRMGTPTEIADAVAFLASEQNTYINGHDLVVDGGYSVGGFQ
jgi:NAD(P)-dependent dehydrogenase (short-subunit alcohol dehydrogenase family)